MSPKKLFPEKKTPPKKFLEKICLEKDCPKLKLPPIKYHKINSPPQKIQKILKKKLKNLEKSGSKGPCCLQLFAGARKKPPQGRTIF